MKTDVESYSQTKSVEAKYISHLYKTRNITEIKQRNSLTKLTQKYIHDKTLQVMHFVRNVKKAKVLWIQANV